MNRAQPFTPLTAEQSLRENMGLRERAQQPTATDPTTVRIAVTANLVGTNINDLQRMIARAVTRGNRWFTLDLRHCPYIDDRGIRGLERAVRFVLHHDGGVRIANANRAQQTLFAQIGLTKSVRLTDEPGEVTL